MFERRVKILLVMLACPAVLASARLVQLQAWQADRYAAAAERMLSLPPKYFPALRGEILDRRGRPLAFDAPVWEVAFHYAFMVEDDALRRRVYRAAGLRAADLPGPQRLQESWRLISRLTGVTLERLGERRDRVVASVARIKAGVRQRRGVETVVLEETMAHTVVGGLDQQMQVEARLALAGCPWIEVRPSHTRRYEGGPALFHIVGRVAEVDAETIASDPRADDELACYRPGEVRGVAGVEAAAEQVLRGRRGRRHEDQKGRALSPPVDPVDGASVRLTIDADIQQAIYARLSAVLRENPGSTGACAVVLDLPSRDVLAAVSCPAVGDPAFASPEDQAARQPWIFRAGLARPPGSIVKPMLLAAAMADGKVAAGTYFTCSGHLFPDRPDRWRCMATYGHGPVDPVTSLQKSCNVFYYHVGQLLGVRRMQDWWPLFGLGEKTGVGLPEESAGRLPDEITEGAARLAAIGQGRLELTPLQAADMAATVATGTHRPLRLWHADASDDRRETPLPVPQAAWRTVREGMYAAVNMPGGTAFRRADFSAPTEFVLLGKTGSAEAPPRQTAYTCRFPDGSVRRIIARNRRALMERFEPAGRPTVLSQEDADPDRDTHAWFIGYLAPRGRHLEPVRPDDGALAVAVLLEYVGHGGEAAAPVAAAILEDVLAGRERPQPAAQAAAGEAPP